MVLGAIAAMLGGGIALRAHGQRVPASLILGVLAAPGLLYALFALLLLILQPGWR